MVSRRVLVGLVLLCVAISATAVAGDALESQDATQEGRRLQGLKKSKPVVVVKKPAKTANKQKNGDDGLNQNNQNANSGEQEDVDQNNNNEDVKIGGRRLQSFKKSKPVVVKKPGKDSNKQKNGGVGLSQNHQNTNSGEQEDVIQNNNNDGKIGSRRLQSSKKSKPIVVVKKPAKTANKQKNGDDGLNQNNQNANSGEQEDVDQYNNNEDVKIGS